MGLPKKPWIRTTPHHAEGSSAPRLPMRSRRRVRGNFELPRHGAPGKSMEKKNIKLEQDWNMVIQCIIYIYMYIYICIYIYIQLYIYVLPFTIYKVSIHTAYCSKTPSGLVFGLGFWAPNTFEDGVWSSGLVYGKQIFNDIHKVAIFK